MGLMPGQDHPWRRKWQPTPVFLMGSAKDRGAWWTTVHGVVESDTAERTTIAHPYVYSFEIP